MREEIGRKSEGEGANNLQEEEEEEWKPRLDLPHTAAFLTGHLGRYYDIITPLPFGLINYFHHRHQLGPASQTCVLINTVNVYVQNHFITR